jgi:hypothetical protein
VPPEQAAAVRLQLDGGERDARGFGRFSVDGSFFASSGHWSEKFTVTVMMTGTGTPFRYVGVNSHERTASSAA